MHDFQLINLVRQEFREFSYVTVDVFGTVRTRVDWFLANNEILRAKTALEIMAVDHMPGDLVMAPVSVSS